MPGLFALNERVLMSGQWVYGYFSMTAVGALNVGSIYLDNYQVIVYYRPVVQSWL